MKEKPTKWVKSMPQRKAVSYSKESPLKNKHDNGINDKPKAKPAHNPCY